MDRLQQSPCTAILPCASHAYLHSLLFLTPVPVLTTLLATAPKSAAVYALLLTRYVITQVVTGMS